MLTEIGIERIRFLEGHRRCQIHVLIGNVLLLEDDGGLLPNTLRQLGMPPENGKQHNRQEENPADHNNRSFRR